MFDDNHIPESVQLPRGRRACRRQANELRVAYQLHRQFAAFARETHELEEQTKGQVQSGQRQLFKLEELTEKTEWLWSCNDSR